MPKTPRCVCGTCERCQAIDRNRRIWEGSERMPWPAEFHTLSLRSAYRQYFGEAAKIARAQHYTGQE